MNKIIAKQLPDLKYLYYIQMMP